MSKLGGVTSRPTGALASPYRLLQCKLMATTRTASGLVSRVAPVQTAPRKVGRGERKRTADEVSKAD